MATFFRVMYVNRLELGIFLRQAPFDSTTYLGWLWSGFQITVALSISAFWIIAFLVGSLFGIYARYPNQPLGHWHLLCRTVS